MTEINLIIFIAIFTALSLVPFTKEFNKLSPYIAVTQLFLAITFLLSRDPMAATDADNYRYMYASVTTFSSVFEAYHGNFTFSYFMFIGKNLSLNVTTFLLIYPVICIILSFIGLRLLVSINYLPIAFGFFAINPGFILLFTNVLRQGLALSFFILGIGCFLKKSKIYKSFACLLLLLAIFSHFSAIILTFSFIIAVKIIQVTRNPDKIIKIITLLMVITPLISSIIMLFPNLIINVSELGGIFSKIDRYSNFGYDSYLFYVKAFLAYFISIVNLFILKKYPPKQNDDYLIVLFIQMLVFVIFLLMPVPLISSRLLYYSELLVSIVIVNMYRTVIMKNTNLAHINAYLLWLAIVASGSFVYLYPSIRANTGF